MLIGNIKKLVNHKSTQPLDYLRISQQVNAMYNYNCEGTRKLENEIYVINRQFWAT